MGASVLVVSFMPPALVRAFLEELPMPFPVVSDPDRKAYQSFGLKHASLLSFLKPSVLLRYVKLTIKGWLPGLPHREADLLQLGGDFVLDVNGNLIFSHISTDAADRPSMETLLRELKKAAT